MLSGFVFLRFVLQTTEDYSMLLLRLVAGIIIFPYGMHKIFEWFKDLGGDVGVCECLMKIERKKIPGFIGWLIIFGQSFGSIALLLFYASTQDPLNHKLSLQHVRSCMSWTSAIAISYWSLLFQCK